MRYFARKTLFHEGTKKVASKQEVEVAEEQAKVLGLTRLSPPVGLYPFLKDKVTGIGRDGITHHVFVKFPCQAGQREVHGSFIRGVDGTYLAADKKATTAVLDLAGLEPCTKEITKDTGDLAGPGVLCESCKKALKAKRGKGRANEGALGKGEDAALLDLFAEEDSSTTES